MTNRAALRSVDRIQGEYMLSINDVMAKTSLGKTTVAELVKAGKFPQPKKIGTLTLWRGSEVDAFIRELFTAL